MLYDASSATCSVFAFKEGLLSAVGHDVKLEVKRFELSIADGSVRATFHANSLEAVCAMREGREDRAALSSSDRKTIEGYVRDDILHARRHPTITFVSQSIEAEDDGFLVEGDLTLHGRTRRVEVPVRSEGGALRARVTLRQPDFGITPFRALLGALRIQPQVEVEVVVPGAAL
jgi:YceI-like domain